MSLVCQVSNSTLVVAFALSLQILQLCNPFQRRSACNTGGLEEHRSCVCVSPMERINLSRETATIQTPKISSSIRSIDVIWVLTSRTRNFRFRQLMSKKLTKPNLLGD